MLNSFPMLVYIFKRMYLTIALWYQPQDWMHSTYGNIEEELPPDMPMLITQG